MLILNIYLVVGQIGNCKLLIVKSHEDHLPQSKKYYARKGWHLIDSEIKLF